MPAEERRQYDPVCGQRETGGGNEVIHSEEKFTFKAFPLAGGIACGSMPPRNLNVVLFPDPQYGTCMRERRIW